MNADLKEGFSRIKPVCDVMMICPTKDSIAAFISRVSDLKKEVVQELQQYLVFPLITHIKSKELEKKHEIQAGLADALRVVLEKVKVNSFEMCIKVETGLLRLIFDNSKPGMIADVPEELKHSVIKCLTELMLNLDDRYREQLLTTQVPLIAQAVFVSVHIAKLEKLRPLRLAAINCLKAHTASHKQRTNSKLETLTLDMLSSILPGVLAALQDVATCADNPGHAVVVASLEEIRRIICLTMNDKYLTKKTEVTAEDFAKMIKDKVQIGESENTDVSSKGKSPKDVPKRTPEWFAMAGEKLTVVTKSLVTLRTHEHYKVRRELAALCATLLTQCNSYLSVAKGPYMPIPIGLPFRNPSPPRIDACITRTMQSSTPLALDVLISLSKDEHPEVSQYCTDAVNAYFTNASHETKQKTMDALCDNFFTLLTSLPRVLNNIDSCRKLSALNLLVGYTEAMCGSGSGSGSGRPQRLTSAVSAHHYMQALCAALLQAASLHSHLSLLTRHSARDVLSPPPASSPWAVLRHLESRECARALQHVCRLLGEAECAELVLDAILDLFRLQPAPEHVYLVNMMLAAPNSSENLVKRVLSTYIEEDVWYLPLEVGSGEAPLTTEDTLDVSVYNPRAWTKDSVPDLYEGATETRYTDISYSTPRLPPYKDPNYCASLAEAQNNMVMSCLLTEGVGIAAKRLMHNYQPYLLKTLCLILERVGSKFEMLHLAGLKAINDIATACGHNTVVELIKYNADYFTSQITGRLKKAWNCQSALQILSVVMEYSDSTLLDCLYGIVQDVLVQSCDIYHQKDLYAYLQVFLAFIECIKKWFPHDPQETKQSSKNDNKIDLLKDVREYIKNTEEAERLLSNSEFEKETGRSLDDMYNEDLKNKEDELLDYDDTVAPEKPPLPQHISVTVTVLKRCLNFITSRQRDDAILALQVINQGLPVLRPYEDELLPLVHLCWAPLVSRFEAREPVVMRRAFDLLVTMADVSKDFIRSRTVKEVLPHIYAYLRKSSEDSYLKDAGSSYRNSQAYSLQVAALAALPHLAVDLGLEDEGLEEAMGCVDAYLSKKQPKPLQTSAVNFFKSILDYEYGTAWHHLRKLCGNDLVLQPPNIDGIELQPVVGTPYLPINKDYENNVKLIFDYMVS